MSTVNADEQLEILDNGSHLGWANVSAGKWSYSHNGLSLGQHSLTAKYKGKVAAAWRVEVIKPSVEHPEGFEDLLDVPYPFLSRPHFNATQKQGDGIRAAMGIQRITSSRAYLYNMALAANLAVYEAGAPHRSVVIRIDFKTVYSELYFGCLIAHMNSNTRTSRIGVFNQSGAEIYYKDFAGLASYTEQLVYFGKKHARNIVAMEIVVSIPYPNTGQEAIWIDNLRMIT